MKAQRQVKLDMGIYAGQIRTVDFDVAERMIRNGVALPVSGNQPQILSTLKPAVASVRKAPNQEDFPTEEQPRDKERAARPRGNKRSRR